MIVIASVTVPFVDFEELVVPVAAVVVAAAVGFGELAELVVQERSEERA